MPPVKHVPGPVPREALDYLIAKGLKPGFSYLDVWKEEHAFAFTVAKIMSRDYLADVQASITGALEEGVTFKDWSRTIQPILDKSGWTSYVSPRERPRRLATIYQTNMRVARAVGQWDRIQRTKRALPFLMYALGPSERHRPEHEAWNGLILPADDPFWETHYPPNGWGCKCHVIQLARGEVDRRGGVDDAPPITFYDWKNPKSGEVEQVPFGIDPGWDYNPGLERAERLAAEL